MRVLVFGSRSVANSRYHEQPVVDAHLAVINTVLLLGHGNYAFIIQGEAPGADSAAKAWALRNGVPTLDFPADWNRFGKRAGYLRNKQMLDEGKPTHAVGFVDKPLAESKGSAMMFDLALKAGIPVHIYNVNTGLKEF